MFYNSIVNTFYAISTIAFLCKEYICCLCGRNQNDSMFNIIKKLSATNILYIKILQALSTKENMFTSSQLKYMNKYIDNVPYTCDDIDNSFKLTLSELTDNNIIICNHGYPIKSGTISLIYKGQIDNKYVIIKVARKNIVYHIENALYQLRIIMKFVLLFNINLQIDVKDFLSQHHSLFLLQTDFLHEVNNLQKMRDNFKNIDTVVIPNVYPEFTNKNNNIIVMDYIDGITLDKVSESEKPKFVDISMKYFLKSLLYDRFYHSDFHPGNVLFITEPSPMLGIIDFGIMDELSIVEQDSMLHLVRVLTTSDDFYESVKPMVDMLIKPQETYQNLLPDNKTYIYKQVGECIENSFYNGKMISPQDLNHINVLLKNYNLYIESSFCKFILALTILDSVTHKLGNNENYITLLKRYGQDMFDMDLFDM